MKRSLFGVLFALSATAAMAAPAHQVLARTADGAASFVHGNLGFVDHRDAAGSAQRVAERAVGLAAGEQLVASKVTADEVGQTHVKFDRRINGLPVVGGEIVVHSDAQGNVFALTGRVARSDVRAAKGRVDAADALVKAARQAGIRNWEPVGNPQQVYLVDDNGQTRLTWTINARYTDKAGNPQMDQVFADASSGDLLARHPKFYYARNRSTYTANNGSSLPGTIRRTEAQAATGDLAIDGAHDGAGTTYDYYLAKHNRDSYNGSGAALISTAHYSSNYNNAYWNGTQMVYGDGDGTQFIALSRSLDVTAHELTHAVTERSANLVYEKEPGALNEAMSDIFGAATEIYKDGGVNADTWKIGDEIYTPGTAGDALRYMNNPTQDGYSKDYYPERLYPGACTPNPNTNDQCGVHGNSGIANLAFYLLVQGGTHPRGKTTTVVTGIGITQAEKIFYRALTIGYMNSTTNFAGARTATIQAATDLYGAGSAAVTQVGNAWTAVGVAGAAPPGALTKGVPVTGLSDSTGGQKTWTLAVPAGSTNLTFTISGGTGDADMYVKFGSAPTTSSYDCRPYKTGNAETCTFATPSTGTYYVMLNAYSAYSGVTLTGNYTTGSTNPAPTANFTFTTNGLTATFTNTSTDSNGTIASSAWNFGNGSTSTSTSPSHTYAAAGTYNVTLTVTDNGGATGTVTKSVTVTAPSGCAGTQYSGTLAAGASAIQPGGTYYQSTVSGTHTGKLTGPAGTDFDLYFYKWSGSAWSQVASGTTASNVENTSYTGTAGYYEYKVTAYSGSGSYTLCITKP